MTAFIIFFIWIWVQEIVLFSCVKRINNKYEKRVKKIYQVLGFILMFIPGAIILPPLIVLIYESNH